ncbi:MAG: N-6 DNA methylase [Candidatus Bathyarchaeota archaeon]|nr:N-6 DNA methylase [Candidatus Bathyarchaeota archaeon]MDH5745431.1 N-6 DNA methylase [Candidatus Bathyarchaeota archaeon]
MKECLEYIYRRVAENPLMSEDELYEVLINSRFFRKLGYKKFGKDVRAQRVVPGKRKKADYVCRDEYQNAVFVLEAKKPSHRTLSDALSQLWNRYVLPLKARYGALTNGWKFMVYKKIGENPERILTVDLSKISQKKSDKLFRILKKPEYDLTLYSRVEEYFSSVEKLSLKTQLAKEDFFETFKLEEDSVFGSLLTSLVELFDFVYPKSKFLKGAYGFWQKSLARKPKKIPDSWAPFLKEKRDVFRCMFCLETAHALLARLIVAKACEDLDFPGISVSGFTLQKIHQVRGQIPLVAYPLVLSGVIREMRDQLVYSLFEDDIFGWWRDGFTEFMQKSSSELLQESVDKRLEDFSEAAAKVIFMLYKFDFREVAGDPLGDLYQKYFDKDTRKALGEFYTPVEVVDYILDAVGYKNIGSNRLLDPACGSGTFIVEALERYLREAEGKAKKHGWAYVLRELCNSPKIVGFDIHPFACLIARTRFMLELIPYFKKALEEEAPRIFYLKRIPIFRTDSLAIEMLPPEFQKQLQLAETEEDIVFPVTLPMKIDSESSISVDIILPSWRKILSQELPLYNLDEYFCTLQAMFDAIKIQLRVRGEHVPEEGLKGPLQEYLRDKDFTLLANFFKPYADHILGETKRIESEFEDGRLIKSIEDGVLASLLKNYLRYEFVVGNPPYVKVQRIPKHLRNQYRESYETAYGKFDLYILFLEKGIDWLQKSGKIGFITNNKFVQSHYGKSIREFILKNCIIEQFLDFGDSGVFSEVTNYPSIYILTKTKRPDHNMRFVRVKKTKENLLDHIKKSIGKQEYSDLYVDIFQVNQSNLEKEKWRFLPETHFRLMKKIEKNSDYTLEKICKRISVGIQATPIDIFWVHLMHDLPNGLARIQPLGYLNTGKYFEIEKALLKKLIKGEFIKRWDIDWQNLWIIYPHRIDQGKVVVIPRTELEKLYPKTWAYFKEHEKILKSKEYLMNAIKNGLRHEWYEIWCPRNPEWLGQKKVVTPDVSDKSNFALDEEKYYITDTTYGLILKDNFRDKYNYYLLLAELNSKLLEFYLKQTSPFVSGKYFRYKTQYLEKLPIRLVMSDQEKEIVGQIAQIVQKIRHQVKPKRLVEEFPEIYLKHYRLRGEEFDDVKHTFNTDHSELKPFLSGLSGKGYVVYPSEGEDSIWVDTKEKAQYLILALRNRKVNQNETVKILVPRDNSIVTEILENVKKTAEEVKATPIEQLEEELNELVYQLYSMNEDDKTIIESFLEKF